MAIQKLIVFFTFFVLLAFMEQTKLAMSSAGMLHYSFLGQGTHQKGGGDSTVFYYFPPHGSQSKIVITLCYNNAFLDQGTHQEEGETPLFSIISHHRFLSLRLLKVKCNEIC